VANPTFLGLEYSTPLTINSKERVSRSETLNLRIQAVSNGSQRWECIITLAPSNNKGAAAANHHGARLAVHRVKYGLHSSFNDAPMPQYLGTEFTYKNGDPITSTGFNVVAVGASTINRINTSIVRIGGASTAIVSVGRFFTFSNHTKVYQVAVADDDVLSAGTDITIFPALLENVNDDNITVNFLDPDITAYYNADGIEGVTYSGGIMTNATIDLIENVAI